VCLLVANGYSRYDTVCNPANGRCACVDGYKPEGLSCRKCNRFFFIPKSFLHFQYLYNSPGYAVLHV